MCLLQKSIILWTNFEEHKLRVLEQHSNEMSDAHGHNIRRLFKRWNMEVGSKPYEISWIDVWIKHKHKLYFVVCSESGIVIQNSSKILYKNRMSSRLSICNK